MIFPLGLLQEPQASLGERILVGVVSVAVGVYFILVGRNNIKSRSAEETGKRAALLSMLGRSTSMSGGKAVAVGWMRIVIGVVLIGIGIAYMILGDFARR